MSGLVQEYLRSWEAELLQLRANDPLIDLTSSAILNTETELWNDTQESRQLLREVRRIERERGVIALVHFEGLLTWKKGTQLLQTPVFLRECTTFNPQGQKLAFEEAAFLNPFISLQLKKNLNVELTEQEPENY
ncbi:MAG: hypothetical protein RJB25_1093, partial [Bacteroidota bacterium]